MAEHLCRSCGGAVVASATTCPHCGVPDPVVTPAATGPAAPAPAGALPERESPGSRLQNAAKAIGCVVLALIVLAVALVIGVFDVLF
ncbi:MAG TPA: hypothetical protein VMM12_07590 [Longimicrobiales bacterium]|nr:hypothetical protein [Longimicrobiales bacterium]